MLPKLISPSRNGLSIPFGGEPVTFSMETGICKHDKGKEKFSHTIYFRDISLDIEINLKVN